LAAAAAASLKEIFEYLNIYLSEVTDESRIIIIIIIIPLLFIPKIIHT
jgi:hypothetical protein